MPKEELNVLISLKALEAKIDIDPKDKNQVYLSIVVRRDKQQRMETEPFQHINLNSKSVTDVKNNKKIYEEFIKLFRKK